jgi:peptide/nickel transport system substrate-binding protein
VSLAIDRTRLVDIALAGFGVPAIGAVSPGHPLAADGSGRTSDTAGVRRLPAERADSAAASHWLDDAGWRAGRDGWRTRDGQPLRFTLSTVGSGDNALEQLVQADLRRVGIAVEIRQRELGAFLAEARGERKQFDALVTGIPGDLALSQLAGLFDGAQRRGALDYTGRTLPALDSAFAATRHATSDAALRDAWRQVQRLLDEDVPVAWLYHARGVQGVRRRLRGVEMDLRGELATLPRWWVDTVAQ